MLNPVSPRRVGNKFGRNSSKALCRHQGFSEKRMNERKIDYFREPVDLFPRKAKNIDFDVILVTCASKDKLRKDASMLGKS